MSSQQPQDDAMTQDTGSRIDLLPVLRTLADGVRGMGIGDPDSGGRVTASDVVRWAVEEIERLRITDAERDAIETAMNAYGEHNDDPECETIEAVLWGLLERTKNGRM